MVFDAEILRSLETQQKLAHNPNFQVWEGAERRNLDGIAKITLGLSLLHFKATLEKRPSVSFNKIMNVSEALPLRLTAHGGEDQSVRECLPEAHLCSESGSLSHKCERT